MDLSLEKLTLTALDFKVGILWLLEDFFEVVHMFLPHLREDHDVIQIAQSELSALCKDLT